MDTIPKQLETALLSPESHGNIIVAIPKDNCIHDAELIADSLSVRSSVENAVLPQSVFGADFSFVFSYKEKFSLPEYKKNFLEKCENLGDNVSIAVI